MSDTPLTDIKNKALDILKALDDPLSYINPERIIRENLKEIVRIVDDTLGDEHG